MKKSHLVLAIATLFSANTFANDFHLSPEIKIGPYGGFGIQAGVTDALGFDAAFISYGRTVYSSSMYDETIDSYRFGVQHMFGAAKIHGMQLEAGIANYDGKKTKSGNTTKESALGSSIGASYVFQATDNLGLRAGVDLNYFPMSDTYIPYDLSTNFNIGMTFTF
ncbi:hypothetical protein [Aliivibrio sifiae]|uniref:Outer membrane protein beta-barrel domain-containing protein n=1 Tax=Aliivibrio sifiae TaxID=566293 RepID=A0A2S7XFL6_9GAMM|nr:hypothetical protein [Aliivibrio sifiae]PQJ89866.1 hypothetical protein BTO22_09840 [Aliivibrio sifiae]